MPRRATHETTLITFPTKGLVETRAYSQQPAGTTIDCLNVRAFDPDEDRARGGKRSGLSKYCSSTINGANDIQDIIHVVTSTSGSGATAVSVRTLTLYAVSNGAVKLVTRSAVSAVSGSATISASVPFLFSADLLGVIYWVDGTNYAKLTVSTNTLSAWTAAAGSLPASTSYVPRLIETWNGRIVLSGMRGDGQNVFFSKQGDPTDWNYVPTTPTEQDAVALNSSLLGKVGDVVTGLVPYSDDVLIIGCDHSLWQLSGDPMAGGRLDRISDVTGMAFGRAWCKDPEGRVYFWGAQGGVFRMVPGSIPERISTTTIEQRLRIVNLNTGYIRMAWNDLEQGVNIWCCPTVTGAGWFNLFYDTRAGGWWLDAYRDAAMYPRTVHVMDGDDPGDRTILLGCRDGYIRQLDPAALGDDGTAIVSQVMMGPFRPRGQSGTVVFDQLDVIMGGTTNTITNLIRIHAGSDEEDAIAGSAAEIDDLLTEDGCVLITENGDTADWYATGYAGTNPTHHPRVRGDVCYIELANTDAINRWALERMELRMQKTSGRN